MTRFDRRTIWALLAFFVADLLLTPFWSGWVVEARLDPLLAVPPRFVTLLVPVLLLAPLERKARATGLALALIVMSVAHLLMTTTMAVRTGWQQHSALFIISVLWCALADGVVQHWRARGKGWAGAGIIIAAALLLSLVAGFAIRKAYMPPARQTPLTLLTSLPLLWGEAENADIAAALQGDAAAPAPAYRLLQQRFAVTPIDAVTRESLPEQGVLLVAHPRALAPAELVALDAWVRGGGKTLILADAFLAWEPPYPLGDKRNPPVTSLLTPLLDHWGLDLILPANGPERPDLRIDDGPHRLALAAPGIFAPKGAAKGVACAIQLGGALADCTVGKGRALLLGDADLLDAQHWLAPAFLDSGDEDLSPALWRADNMAWLSERLDALADPSPDQPASQPRAQPVRLKL